MATKSFITEFSVNKNNAGKLEKALRHSKPITLSMDKKVIEVPKEQIKQFFGRNK